MIYKILFLTVIALLNACAITRAPSLNLLEKRSDFDGVQEIESALDAVDNPLLVPVRTEPVVADIWVHPHELANGDYFRGAWIRTVVSRSSWQVDEKHEPLIVKEKPKPEATTTVRRGARDGK
ncbi:MAG: TraV family lipoprotein [Oligoflexales bacterium]|nr:TraV family lipoprotein [Oligoflexales bacterium]